MLEKMFNGLFSPFYRLRRRLGRFSFFFFICSKSFRYPRRYDGSEEIKRYKNILAGTRTHAHTHNQPEHFIICLHGPDRTIWDPYFAYTYVYTYAYI